MKIETKELVKSFDGFRALDGLNMSVPQGTVYGLVGPNGAGKSTLIRHLAGIYRQDGGEVLIDGEPIFENTAKKSRIAYIPDEIFFFTQFSVRDMLQFYSKIYPDFSRDRFDALGKDFDIDLKRPMRKLSKGMQKQAAFRLALAQNPEIVILDEPVDGLDPIVRRRMWSVLLSDVAEKGTTVLLSSHNLRELEDVCDRVGIMNRGKMLLERSLCDLQENIVKIQLALPEGAQLPDGLDVLHTSVTGRLHQLILRGKAEELSAKIAAVQPLFFDIIPLSLEEIFIYELGGADSEIRESLI